MESSRGWENQAVGGWDRYHRADPEEPAGRGVPPLPAGYDEEHRFAPLYDDADRLAVACDTVLLAVGQATNLDFLDDGGTDVEQFRPGWPKVDRQTLATTAPGVFVAGDLAHGTRLLIDAVASGKARPVPCTLMSRGRQLAAKRDRPPGRCRVPARRATNRSAGNTCGVAAANC